MGVGASPSPAVTEEAADESEVARVRRVMRLLPLASIAVAGALFLAARAFLELPHGTILRAVVVQGVNLGGLTEPQARDTLDSLADSLARRTVLLSLPGGTVPVTLGELGVEPDVDGAVALALAAGRGAGAWARVRERTRSLVVQRRLPLPMRVRRAQALRLLRRVADAAEQSPIGATVELVDGQVVVHPGQPGRIVDLEATLARIEEAFAAAPGPDAIEVAVLPKPALLEPSILAGFGVLGHFHTRFSLRAANRSENIRLATRALNDTILLPGEEFSLNGATGPRTRERGYRLAGVYNGTQADVGYGGGVCQVSTTVYNAAALAGQAITERHRHMRPVPYVAPGRDATVSWGTADLRFRNVTPAPLIIKAWVAGDTVHVALLGRKRVVAPARLSRWDGQRVGTTSRPAPF